MHCSRSLSAAGAVETTTTLTSSTSTTTTAFYKAATSASAAASVCTTPTTKSKTKAMATTTTTTTAATNAKDGKFSIPWRNSTILNLPHFLVSLSRPLSRTNTPRNMRLTRHIIVGHSRHIDQSTNPLVCPIYNSPKCRLSH
nr:bypass of stop codon protein 1-like [Drosophila takahashii]XP_044250315.1 bypass of stop codon protein 1-like [Drosophila takahashii]XP_044250316.1 bypass of stop codon protein 1-like [Drosophila takahashii]XP_044250317.1 bypass of stop codon protein 1-like [Drosophila takahashii]XP_044250318.1 bypass of stop codon protein 1-like [Drosophila takahashii]